MRASDEEIDRLIAQLGEARPGNSQPPAPPLPPIGTGHTSGGMDPWQTSVEKRLDRLTDDMGTVKIDLAVLTERVSHLPTKGWMVGALVLALGVISGLITFSDKIHALIK